MSNVVLALDTCTELCSVALQKGERLVTRQTLAPREHSQKILGFIDEVLADLDIGFDAIERLVVGQGPGSFTGVRIGVSIGQGLAFSHTLPVTPICTLEALAEQAWRRYQATDVIAAIDARMNEVYIARYQRRNDAWIAIQAPQMAALEQLSKELWLDDGEPVGVGTGWQAYGQQLDAEQRVSILPDVWLPEARDMLSLALHPHAKSVQAAELEPLYVRNEVTWKKLPGR
ncbi:tRNA (adenosine(37)-N6)-threonylcarbamoyltransferase complex dimerization subunit type 1 TsaB [Pseudidiomarina aestuarii]|uniref:tRNA threonylcarbamoyladenosine biosynthesis protein TsaB n=1 Tax=Pseudidiomarina aestuarii TaxID=624146 RepID=A0A7Z7ETS1_9GAMM|nr:tRNA (adenosine(37)-N6)-threonylcarbamoyltransferase complex dimerization subunit type 1 TsaB [Pseudidiomarina aestuarii]RUO41320.1 tRNA (adenosine(37)-N6)-threonylcarbamoyltransferase complex dimerization subunit type 1 TsaB [Pseudidiomarina aestuarii]